MGKIRPNVKTQSNRLSQDWRCKCTFHDVYCSLDDDKESFQTFSRSSNDFNRDHLKWLEDNEKLNENDELKLLSALGKKVRGKLYV